MIEKHESEALAVPLLGTVVSLNSPDEVARTLQDVRNAESQLREIKRILTEALSQESQRQGSKSFDTSAGRVEIRSGSEVEWDIDALEEGLRALGCSDNLLQEIIKTEVTYKVDARRAQRAAKANPVYGRVIESARTEHEKAPYVVIGDCG